MASHNYRVLLLLFLSLGTGCAIVPLDQAFRASKPLVEKPLIDMLLVSVGDDNRPLGDRSHVGSGAVSLIPFAPYGHQQRAAMPIVKSSYLREIANTVVKDMRAAGFADLVCIDDPYDPRLGGDKRVHYMKLNLVEGVWDRYITAYGISFAGELLWLAGFPLSYGKVTLGVEAEVLDKDRVSLGKRLFVEKVTITEWIYCPVMHAFNPKLVDAYEQLSPRLRAFVAETLRKS